MSETKSEYPLDELREVIGKYQNTRTVLIHSDLYVSSKILFGNKINGRAELLEKHFKIIKKLFSDFDIWMPAFNYDFFTTQFFDVQKDIVQLGPFPEYFRKSIAEWRTPIPILSFCGSGNEPKVNLPYEFVLYESHPAYHDLMDKNGLIFYYGTNLWSTAFIHFIESYNSKPLYRYDKNFYGKVIHQNGKITEHKVISHVRPVGKQVISYNLTEIQIELLKEDILKSVRINEGEFYILPCRDLLEFLKVKIEKDPFYLLHKSAREWVEPKVEKLGRRFQIGDFESTES